MPTPADLLQKLQECVSICEKLCELTKVAKDGEPGSGPHPGGESQAEQNLAIGRNADGSKIQSGQGRTLPSTWSERQAAKGIGVPAKNIDDNRARAVSSYSGTGK